MEVRLLGERDEASYLALRSRSIEEHAELATPEILRELDTARAGTGGLLVAYGEEQKSVVGAFYGGSLVGVVGLDADRGNRNPQDIRLWGLYVVPRLRGTPISQLLLEEAIAWSRRQRGKMTVSVQFSSKNQHAFRFFNRNYFSAKAPDTGPDAQPSTPGAVSMDYFLGE
jgi:GNAT superfamily N-acetyltransferase